ncbi:hypothetical protein BKA66DRAFT_151742 [Pyrenochaeta sp. MPI-SDFR-AT-0127]|nr:hypothetical protein BKA66DRAFT_151742 [Pyrenochaeta sp. MPI-SDFR-AT-0127]
MQTTVTKAPFSTETGEGSPIMALESVGKKTARVCDDKDEIVDDVLFAPCLTSGPQQVLLCAENTSPINPTMSQTSKLTVGPIEKIADQDKAAHSVHASPIPASLPLSNLPTILPLVAQSLQRIPQPTSSNYKYKPQTLIKALPAAIRDRAKSLIPEPLEQAWTYPPNARYYIGDPEAFQRLPQTRIPWFVTTGVLKETETGLMWAAIGTYLLINYPSDTPSATDKAVIEPVTKNYFNSMAKARYEMEIFVPSEKPGTPMVEEYDLVPSAPFPSKQKCVRINRRGSSLDLESGISQAEVVTDNEGRTAREWNH